MDLISYLKKIETKYDVIFSYADNDVSKIVLEYSEKSKSLDEHLHYLKQKTPFRYVIQNEKKILIVPRSDLKTICISVNDKNTNEVVTNSWLKYNHNTYKADDSGHFYISTNEEKLRITLFADHFNSKKFTVDTSLEKDCYTFKINSHFQVLDEVILTNFLTKGIEKIKSGGIEVNYEDFGSLPGLVEPDVLQTLQALPGITSRRESVSYLNVRGGTHDQNLFLWDGIKMYNTSHFFGMISAFNPYMTNKVSLVKNGTSSKYGGGVSSLINMKSSDDIADELKAELGLNLINIDAIIELPLNDDSSIQFSSRQSINTFWESPTYNQYFDKVFQNTQVTDFETPNSTQNDEFNFYDASLNYKHHITDKDFLKVNLFYGEDEFALKRFDGEETSTKTRSSKLEQTTIAAGIKYEKKWSESIRSQLHLYTSNYNQNAFNNDLINLQNLKQINEVREQGVKLNLQTKLNSIFALESGYQLNETGILNSQDINDPEFFRETQNSILTNSIYSQINYESKNDELNLNMGGRINHYSKFDDILFEPRFNMSYQFINDLYLEILAEQKSQVTSQIVNLQTDFLGVENRRWVLSIPENRPIIESDQISAGLSLVKESWFINAEAYFKNVNGITTQSQSFQNQFEFSDTHGSYEIKGVDFLINKNFDPLSGWVSYSLSENTYRFEALTPTSFHNNLDIKHVVSLGLSYERNGLKISTGFNWHSGAPTTIPTDEQELLPQQIQFQTPNSNRLEDYFRLDLSSTYEFSLFKNTQALTGISFWNLLGNSNVYNQFYSIGDNDNIHRFHQNGLGFTPNLVFRVYFD